MLTGFGTILIVIILVAILAVGLLATRRVMRPIRPDSGREASSERDRIGKVLRPRFDVGFFTIALAALSLVLGAILLLPLVIALPGSGTAIFYPGLAVALILLIGHVYLWRKGDLDRSLLSSIPGRLRALILPGKLRIESPADGGMNEE